MFLRFGKWLEPKILIGIAAASFALWVFIELAENVIDGETRYFDTVILMAFQQTDSLHPGWFYEFVRDISGLGGLGVLGFLVVISAIFLAVSNRVRTALFVIAATSSGAMLSGLLKLGFDRPRPDLFRI